MSLAFYLSRVLAGRIAGAAVVLLALGLSLDLIRAADELIEFGGAPALAHYSALRAPGLLAQILPLAVLVGALMGFLTLGRRSELTVMRAAGQSVFRLLFKLAPMALVLGGIQHLLIAEGMAWSERSLAGTFAGIADLPAPQAGARVAGRVGEAVVIARLTRRDGRELAPLMVFALGEDGHVTGRLDAERAIWSRGEWRLVEARRIGRTPGADRPDRLWPTPLDPETVRALASGEAAASASESAAALAGFVVPTRSTAYYQTRVARAWSAFVVPGVMLLCAAFASFKTARGPGGFRLAALGAVLGLAFVMVDGVFGSFGQVGLVPAAVAAWVPACLFAAAAAWTLLMNEE